MVLDDRVEAVSRAARNRCIQLNDLGCAGVRSGPGLRQRNAGPLTHHHVVGIARRQPADGRRVGADPVHHRLAGYEAVVVAQIDGIADDPGSGKRVKNLVELMPVAAGARRIEIQDDGLANERVFGRASESVSARACEPHRRALISVDNRVVDPTVLEPTEVDPPSVGVDDGIPADHPVDVSEIDDILRIVDGRRYLVGSFDPMGESTRSLGIQDDGRAPGFGQSQLNLRAVLRFERFARRLQHVVEITVGQSADSGGAAGAIDHRIPGLQTKVVAEPNEPFFAISRTGHRSRGVKDRFEGMPRTTRGRGVEENQLGVVGFGLLLRRGERDARRARLDHIVDIAAHQPIDALAITGLVDHGLSASEAMGVAQLDCILGKRGIGDTLEAVAIPLDIGAVDVHDSWLLRERVSLRFGQLHRRLVDDHHVIDATIGQTADGDSISNLIHERIARLEAVLISEINGVARAVHGDRRIELRRAQRGTCRDVGIDIRDDDVDGDRTPERELSRPEAADRGGGNNRDRRRVDLHIAPDRADDRIFDVGLGGIDDVVVGDRRADRPFLAAAQLSGRGGDDGKVRRCRDDVLRGGHAGVFGNVRVDGVHHDVHNERPA